MSKRQKLTRIIADRGPVSGETAVFPIQTKRDRLLPTWIANAKKAARTRKRLKAARAASLEAQRKERAA